MVEPKYCLIQFKVTYRTIPGEEIRVVGNIQELGNWNPLLAEKMVTSKIEYPVWKTKENIKVRQDVDIQYKYVIYKNGKMDRWEMLPEENNRNLRLKNMIRIIVHDIQGIIHGKIEKFTRLSSIEAKEDTPKRDSGTYYEEDEDKRFDFRESKIKKFFLSESFNQRPSLNSMLNRRESTLNNFKDEDDELKNFNYEAEEEIYFPSEKSKHMEKELANTDRIIMCSLYLPFNAVKRDNGEWDVALTDDPFYNTLFKLCRNKENVIWIGLLKNLYQIKDDDIRESIIVKLQKKYNMHVIKFDQKSTMRLNKLISSILEPLFHYITVFHTFKQIKEFEEMWNSYKEFNELVSKCVTANLSENSLVFLHDYYFFLAPSFIYNAHHIISRIISKVSIGLYIHSPFPSHDVFSKFPFREEILKSMMNCSLIGFHTFDSSRNFLTCCRRLLLINSISILKGDLALSYYGRNVIIRVKHVASTPEFIQQEIQNEIFQSVFNKIRTKYVDKYVFVSVDNMHFLAGVKHKMEAYKRFLRDIGDSYKQNILLQYIDTTEDESLLTEEDLEANMGLKSSIFDLAKSIKKEFGDDIIDVIEKKITYTERLAILASGKCYVKASKRESFSLDVYDFLNLKIYMNDTTEMGYILSELSGVTYSLSGAIRVNPFDIHSIKKGFEEAFQVHFDKINISTSLEKDVIHVKKNNTSQWMYSFLKELKNSIDLDDDTYYLGAGVGLNFRLMKISSNFKELNKNELLDDYQKSHKRLILLDYEGTLPASSTQEYLSKGLSPNTKMLTTLDYLTKDRRNVIFIVTGREAKLVSEWFSSVPNLGLASEHGFLYRYSTNVKAKDKWEKMLKGFNGDWRSFCVEQLEPYTERCEGSFIEVKEASVVWQYRDCDPELGKSFAQVITSDFENSLKSLKLKVINGKGYVEIKPEGINKGAFASFLLKEEIKKKRVPDFILAIGDDTADEEMFKYFNKKIPEIKKYSKNVKLYTVTVGKKPSNANCYVDSILDVRTILEGFMHISNRKTIFNSTYNIRAFNIFNESSTTFSNDKNNLGNQTNSENDI